MRSLKMLVICSTLFAINTSFGKPTTRVNDALVIDMLPNYPPVIIPEILGNARKADQKTTTTPQAAKAFKSAKKNTKQIM